MSWIAFRGSGGGYPFWPALAEKAGDVDRGLLLSACAALAAASGGPFVRFVHGGVPAWSTSVPLSRHRLDRALAWLFDEKPDAGSTAPLDVVRLVARREGPVHHFHDERIRAALASAVGLSGASRAGSVVPGVVWWEGDVEGWKRGIVEWLVGAGLHGGVPEPRLHRAIDCLLDDLHAEHATGRMAFAKTGSLDAYVRSRYRPRDGSVLPFLSYDVLWGDVRGITGIVGTRPPPSSDENARLRRDLCNMVRIVQKAGAHHLTYLRVVRARCMLAGRPVALKDVLKPTVRDIQELSGIAPHTGTVTC